MLILVLLTGLGLNFALAQTLHNGAGSMSITHKDRSMSYIRSPSSRSMSVNTNTGAMSINRSPKVHKDADWSSFPVRATSRITDDDENDYTRVNSLSVAESQQKDDHLEEDNAKDWSSLLAWYKRINDGDENDSTTVNSLSVAESQQKDDHLEEITINSSTAGSIDDSMKDTTETTNTTAPSARSMNDSPKGTDTLWIVLGVVGGLLILAQTAAVIYFKRKAQKASLNRRLMSERKSSDDDRSRYSGLPKARKAVPKKTIAVAEDGVRESQTYESVELDQMGPPKHIPTTAIKPTLPPVLVNLEPHPSPIIRAREKENLVAKAILNRPRCPLPDEEIYEEIPNLQSHVKPPEDSTSQAHHTGTLPPMPKPGVPTIPQQVIDSRSLPRKPTPAKPGMVYPSINELAHVLQKRRHEPPVPSKPKRNVPPSNQSMTTRLPRSTEDGPPNLRQSPKKPPPVVLAKPKKPPVPLPIEPPSPNRDSEYYEWSFEPLKPIEEVMKYRK